MDLRRNFKISALAAALALAAFPALSQAPAAAAATSSAAKVVPHLPDPFEDQDDVPLPDPDLWQRIRVGFMLDALDTPLVHEHEDWYVKRPEYIKRFVDRGSRYLHYIVEQVEKRKMPMEVALLPVVESAFTPRAMSRAKASGIWQFIPSTGKSYGLTQDAWRDNRNDVIAATDAALNYLQRLYDMFGKWELALAAYNCGEGCVARAIGANQKRGLPTDYLSLKLPPETRNYVPKLIAVKNIVLSPGSYGIEIDSIPDTPYFTTVQAPARIDVKLAARLAEMSEADFAALNPAHNRPVAVGSAGTNTLVVPLDKADAFKANLESYDKPLVTWTTYNARRGEAVDAIAKHHGIGAAELRGANEGLKLDKKGRLRVATAIMVPIRSSAQAKAPAPIHITDAKVAQVTAAPSKPARISVSTPTASSAGSPARPAPQPGASTRFYTVRQGDTLYAIAQKFGMGVDTLRALNKLGTRAVIQPGLRLRLS